MKTVAITGRSGCGKSQVTAHYAALGYPIADADLVAREVLMPGSPCIAQLCSRFGDDILDTEGNLQRRLLADRAFATPEGTADLTSITHPEIIRRLMDAKHRAKESGAEIFFVDGAVILNSAFEKECDGIMLVATPLETSVQRICARDQISPEMARRRLDAQPSEKWLRSRSDYGLENDSDIETMIERADEALQFWKNKEM